MTEGKAPLPRGPAHVNLKPNIGHEGFETGPSLSLLLL